ncbi:uncharacterized protein [Malus domestica]|uniref:uncharacterized protein n=1 Tax=Malus domestica TaxID=3750 RepID=UPI00397653F0
MGNDGNYGGGVVGGGSGVRLVIAVVGGGGDDNSGGGSGDGNNNGGCMVMVPIVCCGGGSDNYGYSGGNDGGDNGGSGGCYCVCGGNSGGCGGGGGIGGDDCASSDGGVRCLSSHDMWINLKDRFSTVTKFSIFQLKTELQNIKKGSDSVSTYLQRIKDVRDHLSVAGVTFEDDDILLEEEATVEHNFTSEPFVTAMVAQDKQGKGKALMLGEGSSSGFS